MWACEGEDVERYPEGEAGGFEGGCDEDVERFEGLVG